MIPKKIHIFWHDLNEIPTIVEKLIINIKKINYDFNVKVYSLKDFPFPYNKNILPQYLSDIFRLYILYKEGGIYIDASCIFFKNLKDFIDLNDNRLQFYTNLKGHTIENWFLVSPPKTKLIYNWLKEVLLVQSVGIDKYIKYYKKFSNPYLNKYLPYLVNFLAFNVAYYKLENKNSKLITSNKYIKNLGLAGDEYNPLYYLKINNWNKKKAIHYLLNNNNFKENFIKLRGPERKLFINSIINHNYNKNSPIIQLLNI